MVNGCTTLPLPLGPSAGHAVEPKLPTEPHQGLPAQQRRPRREPSRAACSAACFAQSQAPAARARKAACVERRDANAERSRR